MSLFNLNFNILANLQQHLPFSKRFFFGVFGARQTIRIDTGCDLVTTFLSIGTDYQLVFIPIFYMGQEYVNSAL
jgi:hypothetical protein